MPQRMIHQHQRQHRLGDRRRAYAYAGVVAAVRFDDGRVALQVDGAARQADAGSGLDREVRNYILTGGDAAEDAAGVVG